MVDVERSKQLRSIVAEGGFGLEIGPSTNPIFPKSEGFNVEVLDWTTATALRQKYSDMNMDISRIEEVDYVSEGRSIEDVVPRREEYDFIFSSHAIEHVTDLVSHMRSCDKLLKPDGILAMAIPDKRYTFDTLRATSTVGQVLEAYCRKSTKHSPAAVYDFISTCAHLNGKDVFTSSDHGPVATQNSIQGAYHLLAETLSEKGPYHDVHGWVFTPASFKLIMSDLYELGLTQLTIFYMLEMNGLEFHVGLSKDKDTPRPSRISLLRDMLQEQVVSGTQLLAGWHDA